MTHDYPPGLPCGCETLCRWCEAMGPYFDAQADLSTAGSREIAQHTAEQVRRDLREESE